MFLDYFIRTLPDFQKNQFSSLREQFSMSIKPDLASPNSTSSKASVTRKMAELQKVINEEIEDCIDSVSKLAPLVPVYIHYNSAEISTAAVSWVICIVLITMYRS